MQWPAFVAMERSEVRSRHLHDPNAKHASLGASPRLTLVYSLVSIRYLPQASFDFTAPFAGSGDATPMASVSREHAAVVEAREEAPPRDPGDARNRTPVAIILEPARELAEQVSDCLETFKVSRVVLCCIVSCYYGVNCA